VQLGYNTGNEAQAEVAMRTETLEELQVIARCGSFSAAAKELHIARSALTAHVNTLERELGFPIFERGQRITATVEGVAFIEGMNEALDIIDKTISRCRIVSTQASPKLPTDQIVRISYGAATPATLAKIKSSTQVPLEFVQFPDQHSFFYVFENDVADCLFQDDYSDYPELVKQADELGLECIDTGPHPRVIVMGSNNPLATRADHLSRQDLNGAEIIVFETIGYERAIARYRSLLGNDIKLSFRFCPMNKVSGWFSLDLGNSLAIVSSPEIDSYLECRDDIAVARKLDGKPLFIKGVLAYRSNDPNPNVAHFVKDFSQMVTAGDFHTR
jgi:DNA-binding transcriptional LysR family regulator